MKKYLWISCLIFISICTLLLGACGEDYTQFSLRFSSPSIELEQNTSSDYEIIIDNYFETDVNFHFAFDTPIVSISQPTEQGNGHFRITVTATEMVGNATLTITLLEGNKKLMIPVSVYEPVQSMQLKDSVDMFVLRGDSITLHSDMLDYYPSSTRQREVNFEIDGQVLTDGILTTDASTADVITVTAVNVYNPNVTYTFNVTVLDAIDTQNISLSYENEVILPIDEDETSYIELIENSDTLFSKTLSLVFDQRYEYQIFVKSNSRIVETMVSPNFENMLFVPIQATDFSLDEDVLVVRVKYPNYDAYYVDIEYRVETVAMPSGVLINGEQDLGIINLFDNDDDSRAKDLLLTVTPMTADYENIALEFYISNNSQLTRVDYEDIDDYICIKYGIGEISNETQITNLTQPLSVFGRSALPQNLGQYVVVRFVVQNDFSTQPVYNDVTFAINKSASNFYVNDEYTNSTIYVKNGESVIFNGFTVEEEDAVVGIITPTGSLLSNSICTVTQTQNSLDNNIAEIEITAHQNGDAQYYLVLESGISTRINILVRDELDLNNLWFYVEDTDNNVAQVEYKQSNSDNNTLSFVAVRNGGEVNIMANIAPRGVSSSMYSIALSNNDLTINGSTISFASADNIRREVTVSITRYIIEDFKLQADDSLAQGGVYNFDIICFEPISTFSFDAKNSSDLEEGFSNNVNVYDLNTPLGFVDRIMAEVDFRYAIGGVEYSFEDLNRFSPEFSFSVNETRDPNTGEYQLSDSGSLIYGYFNPTTGKFLCNATGRPRGSFTITARLYEYGNVISSTVQINIVEYVQVEEVWLYNYMEEIYLDPTNTQQIIYPYLLPQNATNQNFVAWFEPDENTSSTIVQLQYDANSITVTYTGSGGGSGNIVIVPSSWFRSSDRNDVLSRKEIEINVGDGSKENPLHINTFEQFKNIDLTKYYIIDGLIDAGGESVATFGELTGGISGNSASSGIINFVVSTPYSISSGLTRGDYYGLFSSIASGAELSNLTLSGTITIDSLSNTQSSYIGLIAGVNNGTITNVNVTLLESEITSSANSAVYVGGALGQNNGQYIIDTTTNLTPSSTMFVYMGENEFNITTSSTAYVGGVVGDNNGTIQFIGSTVAMYNNYGLSTNVNIVANTSVSNMLHLGGVAGRNTSVIENLIATGRVRADNGRYVGGLIGIMPSGRVYGNISRVFVRGNTFVAGLIGDVNGGAIENNKVQATDDRQSTGLDASLIVGGSNTTSHIFNSSNNVQVDTSNTAQSYVNRTRVVYPQAISDINNYYGEVVILSYTSGQEDVKQFEKAESGQLSQIINSEKYIDNLIVLNYYQAQNSELQSYLSILNTQYLPADLFTEQAQISITSRATSIISVTNDGQLVVHSVGTAVLTLANMLNAADSIDITCVVTQYVGNIELYLTSDYTVPLSQNSLLNISNRNTVSLYPRFNAYAVAGNMQIQLSENRSAKIEVIGNEFVEVSQTSNTIILSGKGNENSARDTVEFYVYVDVNGQKRYLNLQTNMFDVTNIEDQNVYSATIYTSYTQGIYNIEVDKRNITVAPSDRFSISVGYLTDDENDELTLSITYLENGETFTINDEDLSNYFTVSYDSSPTYDEESGRYYLTYTFEMNTSGLIRLGEYLFTFASEDSLVTKNVYVTYQSQPINSVIIKNYSFTDNEEIILIQDDDTYRIYNTSYTMTETNIVTAGQPNILKVLITPSFADYEYVEITNAPQNIQNGNVVLFGLLTQYQNNPGQAVVSSDAYFTSTGIRVLKSSIQSGELNVLYRLATNVIEGQSITLYINFYNTEGEIVYSQQQKILTITLDKTVEITLANREPSDSYYVARGYNYLLNISTQGYAIEDIVIESSSPYGTIVNDNGSYYLRIADNVNYISTQEGYSFTVTYYGTTTVNGVVTSGIRKTFVCTIVEYVVGNIRDLNEVFSDDEIIVNRGNTQDIRDLIVDKIEIEYASGATAAVQALKQSLKSNAFFYFKNGDTFDLVDDDYSYEDDNVRLTGFMMTGKFVGKDVFTLGVYASLHYLAGYLQVSTDVDIDDVSPMDIKTFAVSVNQQSSLENQLPIYTLDDFYSMSEGNYYILMNDIEIPSGYTPINTQIARFDGNGHRFIFGGVYAEYVNVNNFGLFSEIGENTVIANVTIAIDASRSAVLNFRNESGTQAFNFGLLCGINNGTITNCNVVCQSDVTSLIVTNSALVAVTSTSNIAGLVAVNNGYITNSRVSIRIESYGANLAGFVAQNNGHISTSYVKQSLIRNSSTNVNNATGGFVVANNGNIFASFVEGAYTSGLSSLYASDTNYIVRATSIAGAFAYINEGTISNSYANIPVTSSSINSGFVCTNNGEIISSYTTSRLGDRDTGNYPFFITSTGSISDCYYLQAENYNVGINTSNENVEGLRATSIIEFATGYEALGTNTEYTLGEKLFTGFAFNSNNDINSGVWFYATDNNSFENATGISLQTGTVITLAQYRNYLQYSRQISVSTYLQDGQPLLLRENRPQLVGANIIAFSQKIILEQRYDETTGETIYDYAINSNSYAEGTMFNPYIITSAVEFEENFIANSNSFANTNYYRLVKDINYTLEGLVTSSLYNYILAGYIEGNDLTISNFSINTNATLMSGGYFSQIGYGSNYATIQNITFAPRYINLPNALNVGTIAGTVNRAYAYNITVDGYNGENTSKVVLGKNIVGGVFGRTISAFDMQNIYSSISTNAYFTNTSLDWTSQSVQNAILYEEGGSNNTTVSYSGSIIGYLGGIGTIKNANILNQVAIMGMVGGFMFGGIGLNATASDITFMITPGENNFLRVSAYAGFIVGDLKGVLENVNVLSPDQTEEQYPLFKLQPKVTMAIGGLAGIARGNADQIENITNCHVYLDITFSNTDIIIPETVGGLVGKVIENIKISNSTYEGGSITGKNYVGGFIGSITFYDTFKNVQITNSKVGTDENILTNVQGIKPAQDEESLSTYIGALIGAIISDSSFENVLSLQGLEITDTTIYALVSSDVKIYGALLGQGSGTMYSIHASAVIGGLNANVQVIESATFDNVLGSVEIELLASNLRNPELDDNGCPADYNIYLSQALYNFDSGCALISSEEGDMTLNNIPVNFLNSEYISLSN